MYQLNPGSQKIIVRVLADHTDTSTNYVQAVIRNAATDAVIDTVNLTDQGSRRFSKSWDVPNYGNETEIVITTTVYTDSGYTTKNANYGEEAQVFLIAIRWSFALGSGGGGSSVDYKKIREIMKEEIAKAEKIEGKEIDIVGLETRIKERIDALPKPEAPNLAPVLEGLRTLTATLKALPKPEKMNWQPVFDQLDSLSQAEAKNIRTAIEKVRELETAMRDFYVKDSTEMRSMLEKAIEFINAVPVVLVPGQGNTHQLTKPKRDLSLLR